MERSVDWEQEKKKNMRLAIGVAALGVAGFMAAYVVMFALMFLSPFTLFKMFPAFSWTENVTGFNNKLLIISKSVDFKSASREHPPEEKTTIETFDGATVSGPIDLRRFSSLYQTNDRLYFFDEGLYRTFDGEKWTEAKHPAIGSAPKGAVGENGIWVLSTVEGKSVLSLLTAHDIRQIPLPDSTVTNSCYSQLVSVGSGLFLFRKKDNSLFWSEYDGRKWVQTSSFEDEGRYRALPVEGGILLIQVREHRDRPRVIMRTYRNNSWSEPSSYDLPGFSLNTIPVMFRNTPAIYRQELFFQKYYLVEEGRLKGPFPIRKQFFVFGSVVKITAVVLAGNALILLIIFLTSVIIGRFKLRKWRIESGEYEFASLFRRFLAKMIDSFAVSAPIIASFYFLLSENMLRTNPFKFMALALFGIVTLISGGFLYHSLLEGLWGKTLGKKLCDIVVLKDDFTRCTLGKGLTRNLLRIVDGMFYYLVGVATMAGTMKWQRLGDIVAETVVVKDKKKG